MARYEIDYRAADGKPTRRILFADCDDEVAELIRLEGLAEVTVRPSLRRLKPAPPSPPQARADAEPLEVEIVSRPGDGPADPTGGKLDWMSCEDAEELRKRQQYGLARSNEGKRLRQRWQNGGAGGRAIIEQIVAALELGNLEMGREYRLAEIHGVIGKFSGGAEIVALRLAEQTEFRMELIGGPNGRAANARFVFRNKERRQPAAAVAA